MKTEFPIQIEYGQTDRLPYIKFDPTIAAIDSVAEVKRHHIVKITGIVHDIAKVHDWIEQHSGEVETHTPPCRQFEIISKSNQFFMIGRVNYDYRQLKFDTFTILASLTWTFPTDDDLILFKMMWGGAQ